MSQHWQEVEALFQRLVACEGEERARLLAALRGVDADLRQEVESLLEVYERATGVLGSCLRLDPSPQETAAWEGRRLGAHVLLHELGRGGMSRVFLAARADAQFDRFVVIKVVEPEICSPALVRRFLLERQILANLDHGGIARLLDGHTTEDGLPYLVLELIDGEPIDLYCERQGLSPRERVRLFLEVCEAVEYAHRCLVIHRDLKPANVLVTRDGRPKLLDFGIAKLLEPGPTEEGMAATRTLMRALTPRYASPEQLRGDSLTTATDVYSLGVVFLELLSGCAPGRGRGRDRAALASADGAATARADAQRLPGDLRTVVATALGEQPSERYPSVTAFADDLRRWLARRPISARRSNLAYRTGKLIERNPLASSLAFVAALLVVALAVSQVVQGRRVARERNTAEQALEFLAGVFRSADPAAGGAERLTVRQVLDAGTARVREELAAAPEAKARMLEVLGEVYLGLGLADSAQPLLEAALELRRDLHGEGSREVARAFHRLGEAALVRADLPGAERWLRRSLALSREAGGGSAELAAVLEDLGEALAAQDRYGEAEPLLRQALELQLAGPAGGELAAAETADVLADLLRRAGRWQEVESLLGRALELRRRVGGERSPLVARSLDSLGVFLSTQGRFAEAAALYREALGVWRRLHDGDHPELARALQNLGTTLLAMGELDEAAGVLAESLAMMRRLYGETHLNVAFALDSWGGLLATRGEVGPAEEAIDEMLRIRRQLLGDKHTLYAVSLSRRADVRRLRSDLAGAEADYRAALAVFGTAPQQLQRSWALTGMGRLLADRGRLDEAETHFRQAVAEQRSLLPEGHPRLAQTEVDLACILLLSGRIAEGEALLRKAQGTLSERLGATNRRATAAARVMEAVGRLDGSPAAAEELANAASSWRSSR